MPSAPPRSREHLGRAPQRPRRRRRVARVSGAPAPTRRRAQGCRGGDPGSRTRRFWRADGPDHSRAPPRRARTPKRPPPPSGAPHPSSRRERTPTPTLTPRPRLRPGRPDPRAPPMSGRRTLLDVDTGPASPVSTISHARPRRRRGLEPRAGGRPPRDPYLSPGQSFGTAGPKKGAHPPFLRSRGKGHLPEVTFCRLNFCFDSFIRTLCSDRSPSPPSPQVLPPPKSVQGQRPRGCGGQDAPGSPLPSSTTVGTRTCPSPILPDG